MIDHQWKLPLIDSESAAAELASKLPKQALSDCRCITANDAVAFAEQLAVGGFSAIISEQNPGWARGTDVLATFARQYGGVTSYFTLKRTGLGQRGIDQAHELETGILS